MSRTHRTEQPAQRLSEDIIYPFQNRFPCRHFAIIAIELYQYLSLTDPIELLISKTLDNLRRKSGYNTLLVEMLSFRNPS